MTADEPSLAPVVVAVLTYRRPQDLAVVLPELVAQAATVAAARVLVVDNDPAASARPLVVTYAGVTYVHEPKPGIAAARNRALDEALNASVLVFIDDDERPTDRWLAALLATHARTGAAGVVGPVVSTFVADPPAWVVAGRFFERRRLPTGTAVTVAATNNLLLDLEQVRRLGVRLDERFGLSGGSDTLFTREIVRRGGRLVWCDEALVVDRVPVERATRRWVLRRALRSGNSWSRTTVELARPGPPRAGARLTQGAAGAARVLTGLARLAGGLLLRDTGHQARGLRTLARGAGMAAGAAGYTYSEYSRGSEYGRPDHRGG